VVLKRYEGMIHPFVSLAGIVEGGRLAIDEAAAAVRQALTVTAPAGV
jgi:acetyl esterase/lipase